MPHTGILLVNLGTPDAPTAKALRPYLREFLMDERVIDIPKLNRWLLVNLIIAPLRAPKSAAEYKKVWTEKGSPLMFHSVEVAGKLQARMGKDYDVRLAMRYNKPNVEQVVADWERAGLKKILVVPLYPQYASASSGSSIQKVLEVILKWQIVPAVEVMGPYQDDPRYLDAFEKAGKEYLATGNYDHVMFSYHGLPERQILKGSVDSYCQLGKCCGSFHAKNQYCYRAACFQTSRQLAKRMGLADDGYTVSFQSRLGKTPWIKPYTDEVLDELVKKGVKRLLVLSPSFVADCLETTIEIGETYKEQFEHKGGESLTLVPSLNSREEWVDALEGMVRELV